jgi:glycosyltransferase involved in cell wall biosynthesis
VKVGYFSPLPPARTGVADYASALLHALRRVSTVEVNASRPDVNLYHVGNNQLHREIYRRAIEHPGVVILHDAVLHHFYLGAFERDAYVDEFVYNYGEWMRERAAELWKRRARSAADAEYFAFPMLKRLAERSLAIVVHNPSASAAVKKHAPDARVVEIPHLYAGAPATDRDDVDRVRQSLGVSQRGFLFGIFGHLRESKRIASVVRVFEALQDQMPDATLLLSGDCVSTDLKRALEPCAKNPRIRRTGFLQDRAFWTHARATDACINLRYPSAGETSGIAVRFMGIGKPVMLSDGPEVSHIPQSACLRVDTGLREEPMVAEYMVWLNSFRRDAAEIGSRAAAHIAAHHSLESIAQQYQEVLQSVA